MDARHALLGRLFDHAPLFPPASMSPEDALAEDERAARSADSWLLGRFVCPVGFPPVDDRGLAVVSPGAEAHGDFVFIEGLDLDEVVARGGGAKVRCGGERIPSVEELAALIRGCRERGVVLKATAGLHHAYPTDAGEHGFLNLLAAAVFGDEEDALRAPHGSFALDADSLRWDGRASHADELARVRGSLLHSIGSCSFFESVGELHDLGIL
ncbi:MAG TPA: hypothetical protein VN770_02970 [Gaiellaceae bacterium]|nr:hypothetical protein [Gaiellaceae bacterium]